MVEAEVLALDQTAETFGLICLCFISNGCDEVNKRYLFWVTAKFTPLANTWSSVSLGSLSDFSHCKADEGVPCFPVRSGAWW